MINWKTSNTDHDLIRKIATRAGKFTAEAGGRNQAEDTLYFMMDLTVVHANCFELRLAEMLECDDYDFLHDMIGIRQHLNRTTGKLENCFVPRFAIRTL